MSKDYSNVSNDLSWLAGSTFLPSGNQMSSLPKTFESSSVSNIEPWESLTNLNQVRRNLNRNWASKPISVRENDVFDTMHFRPGSNSFPDVTYFSSKESTPKESFLQGAEKSSTWFHDSSLPSTSRDSVGKSSASSYTSSVNQKDSSGARNSYFFADQPSSLNQLLSLNFDNLSVNSGNSASQQSYFQEKLPERFSYPLSPISPSTNSNSSPKLNTDLIALMQELAVLTNNEDSMRHQIPFQTPPCTPTKGCVFCKNNSYHSTFYKSHSLKDDNGHCTCPVLRTYVCPLCGGTGDFAHTLKYCPRNTVTKGDPIAAGLPPGKVTNWREVATKMASQHRH